MSKNEQPIQPPRSDQHAAAFAGPAPGINRFFCSLGATGLRIAFLEESMDRTPHFRAAVTMHPHDAVRLYRALQVMLADFDAEVTELDKDSDG